jgi:triphosphatase
LLASKADRRRRDAYARLAHELRSPALTKLVLAMAVWVEDGAEDPERLGDARLAKPAADLAPDLLGRLARKVAKRGRKLKSRSGPEVHALRKSLEKLRQGVTDFACLTPRRRTKAYGRACADVLDRLGRLQDAAMAEALAAELAADDASLGPAVAQVAAWAAKRRRKHTKHLPAAWRTLREQPSAWTLTTA